MQNSGWVSTPSSDSKIIGWDQAKADRDWYVLWPHGTRRDQNGVQFPAHRFSPAFLPYVAECLARVAAEKQAVPSKPNPIK